MKKIILVSILVSALTIQNSCKKNEKSDPVITWNNPDDISYGTLLSAAQLNATASVPGVFLYSPPIGTKLEIGEMQDLSVVFTPTDASSYNTGTKTVQINVTLYAPLHDPSVPFHFDDAPYNHDMHITSDGNFYFTCNGGNYSFGKISKYTLTGEYVTSYDIGIDMRSIMYNKADGSFYVSGFESSTSERNIYKITNLESGSYSKLLTNLYDNYQSGTAMSADGQFIYAFNAGTLKKYKLSDGTLVQTLTGLSFGETSNAVVAVDNEYIYTWDAATLTVYVYDLAGNAIRNITLSNGNWAYSLSFVDGYLFTATDAAYGTGIWYGYNIRKPLN